MPRRQTQIMRQEGASITERAMLSIRPMQSRENNPSLFTHLDDAAFTLKSFVGMLPLQQTILSPLTSELLRYEWKVWYPQQATHEVGPGGIEEGLALQWLPVLCVRDVVWFKSCRRHTG
jgi:hypothetical protein